MSALLRAESSPMHHATAMRDHCGISSCGLCAAWAANAVASTRCKRECPRRRICAHRGERARAPRAPGRERDAACEEQARSCKYPMSCAAPTRLLWDCPICGIVACDPSCTRCPCNCFSRVLLLPFPTLPPSPFLSVLAGPSIVLSIPSPFSPLIPTFRCADVHEVPQGGCL